MKYAVIDLGSNTFHLMIVHCEGDRLLPFNIVYKESYMTSLSAGGGSVILQKNVDLAIKAAEKMKKGLDRYNVANVKITGTAVLRTAGNRLKMLELLESVFHKKVEVINGDTEAAYVGEGSLLHPALKQGHHLVLDIGGGSTECILLKNGQTGLKASFPLGIGVLKKLFFVRESLTEQQINDATNYIDETVSDYLEELNEIRFDSLTGASGTFEAIEKIHFGKSLYGVEINHMSIEKYKKLHSELIFSDLSTRIHYKNMPQERAVLLPAGLILIDYFIKKIKPKQLQFSHFALKEGILKEMVSMK